MASEGWVPVKAKIATFAEVPSRKKYASSHPPRLLTRLFLCRNALLSSLLFFPLYHRPKAERSQSQARPERPQIMVKEPDDEQQHPKRGRKEGSWLGERGIRDRIDLKYDIPKRQDPDDPKLGKDKQVHIVNRLV